MDRFNAAAGRRLMSRSLIGFGVFTLVSSIIGAFILDALAIDICGLIVIWLGASLSRGSGRVAKWSRIAMLCYLAMAAALVVLGIVLPQRMKIAGHAVSPSQLPYMLVILAIAGVWSFINLGLLRKYKDSFQATIT